MTARGPINQYDRSYLRLLRIAPFERRPRGWRFGTKTIADAVVDRIVASGRAGSDGASVWLITPGAAE